MKNPDLISLWNRYYDSDILERLDLSRAWNYVSTHSRNRLSDLIKTWNHNLADSEIERILQSFETLLNRLNKATHEDRSIFAFSIFPILEHNIKNNRLDIVEILAEHLINIRQSEPRELPSRVIIELTNNCNLNCKMCGVGSVKYSPNRTMPIGSFCKIIDIISDSAKVVRLNGLGESTIIPNFKDYLSFLEGKNIQLELVTNLSINNNDLINYLLDMDFNILISCDSPNPEHLVSIRRGLNIRKFLDNLATIRNYEDRDPMRNNIIFTIMDENFHELPDMIEFAASYNIGGVIGNMVKGDDNRWKIIRFNQLIETFRKAVERARERGIELRLPNQIEGISIRENFVYPTNSEYCPTFKDEIFIRYNGDVCPCNMMNPYIYGNINRREIKNILNNFQAMTFANLTNTEFKHPYCEHCYYIREKSL